LQQKHLLKSRLGFEIECKSFAGAVFILPQTQNKIAQRKLAYPPISKQIGSGLALITDKKN